jgi:glycerol-3-phosphate acyltransferase PlsY
MLYIVSGVVIAYLAGSIPFAYIFGKVLRGIDVREHGSGNVGATNVARTVGKRAAVAVFILDFIKGTVAVTLVPAVLSLLFPVYPDERSYLIIFFGGASIAGHIWPVFLRYRGGKGVSTTAGVMAGLAPSVFAGAFCVWIAVFMIWKYVSLASLAACIALPVFAVISGAGLDLIIFSGVLCMVGIISHRANIRRLLEGTETRVVKTKKSQ